MFENRNKMMSSRAQSLGGSSHDTNNEDHSSNNSLQQAFKLKNLCRRSLQDFDMRGRFNVLVAYEAENSDEDFVG